MAALTLGYLPSLWRQHLLSEFAGLKQACPEGVFVSLTPGDPSLWSAVLFVRNGPYAPAVLRFQISFPEAYPRVPPLVTFSTDIFHPLITPLTTHISTADFQDDGSVERERLPPGGFSLRHGFPEWYGGSRRASSGSRKGSCDRRGARPSSTPGGAKLSPASQKGLPRYMQTNQRTVSTYALLKYIRNAFDKEEALDSVPLSAAGNAGAWHAWRTHRRKQGKVFFERRKYKKTHGEEAKKDNDQQGEVKTSDENTAPSLSKPVRKPGEWNWDGVWEDRVKKGVTSSLSESVLYGSSGVPDDLIHFLAMEEGSVETVKGNLRRTLDATA